MLSGNEGNLGDNDMKALPDENRIMWREFRWRFYKEK